MPKRVLSICGRHPLQLCYERAASIYDRNARVDKIESNFDLIFQNQLQKQMSREEPHFNIHYCQILNINNSSFLFLLFSCSRKDKIKLT